MKHDQACYTSKEHKQKQKEHILIEFRSLICTIINTVAFIDLSIKILHEEVYGCVRVIFKALYFFILIIWFCISGSRVHRIRFHDDRTHALHRVRVHDDDIQFPDYRRVSLQDIP